MLHLSHTLVLLVGFVSTTLASELQLPPDPSLLLQTDVSRLGFDADSGKIIGGFSRFEKSERFSLYTTLAQVGNDYPTDYIQDPEFDRAASKDADASSNVESSSQLDELGAVPPPPRPEEIGAASDIEDKPTTPPTVANWSFEMHDCSCTWVRPDVADSSRMMSSQDSASTGCGSTNSCTGN